MPFVPTLFDQELETYLATQLNTTIWAGHIPQSVSTYPAVVYRLLTETTNYTIASSSGSVVGDYQIDIYGDDMATVEQLGDRLMTSLDSAKGYMGSVYVSGCRLEDASMEYEEKTYGTDQGFYHLMTQWVINHVETIPTF